MWYVGHVRRGCESRVCDMCKKMLPPEVLDDCLLPKREVMRKEDGRWTCITNLLFPGYVFLVSSNQEELKKALKATPLPLRLVGDGAEAFFSLTPREEEWFLSFMDESHVVRMSKGYIEGGVTTVTSGPLKGKEQMIRKIDRHKRRAYIDVALFGQNVPMSIGLEITRKTL